MKQRLAEEVAEVCRDYCSVTWATALNNAGVLAESKLRKAERVFYPKHVREIPTDLSSAALPSPVLKQVPAFRTFLLTLGPLLELVWVRRSLL